MSSWRERGPTRWIALLAFVAMILVAGCAAETIEPEPHRGADTPEEAVLALVDAINAADWETRYALYAEPEVDFETAVSEWETAAETYEDFTVHETRRSAEDLAEVRVTYRAETTPPGGDRYEVVVTGDGEWWAVQRVDGGWKAQWMPRQ